ncbi:MAG TPA: hypothetical protein VM431_10100 [Phycisphaerae bacterium]|nr:hypothetical protein [Phycisphaerae bacterium]
MRTSYWTIALALAAAALMAAVAQAAAPPAPPANVPAAPPAAGDNKVTLSWEKFKEVTGLTEDDLKAREAGAFTLGWAEVEQLLGIKIENVGQGAKVRIPWQEFKALLQWSIQQKKPEAPPPPTDFAVTSAEYAGELSKDGALFTATFKISLLKDKAWKVIPLLPGTVAIQEVTLPKGAHLRLEKNFYEVLTADPPGDIEVKIKFAAAVTEQAGSLALRFDRAPSSTCLLDLKVAQTGVDMAVVGAQSIIKKEEGGATQVLAALPAATPVQLSWERAIPEAEKVPPKLYAETQTLVAVGDGILIGRQRLNFNILHTGVRVLKLKLPKGVSILEVKGERTRDWRVADDELSVALSYEAIGAYVLNVTYEQAVQADQAAGQSLPVLRVMDVVREKGHVGVVALANVELSAPQIKGATAIDVRELPAELLSLTGQPILLAFRYVADDFDIPLSVKKHADVDVLVTIVDSAIVTTMQTMDNRRITRVVYNVRNNRKQFLRLVMPEGAEIWSASVSGKSIRPARDEEGRVLVPLVRSEGASSGLSAFPVELVYVEKAEGDAKPPAGGTLHIDLPQAAEPVTHLMMNLYLPKQGKYTRGWGNEPAIDGPLTVVKDFRKLLGAVGEPARAAEQEAEALQVTAQAQVDATTAAAGATPIRVNLPIDGQLFRLEKILVLDEPLFVDVQYGGWEKK